MRAPTAYILWPGRAGISYDVRVSCVSGNRSSPRDSLVIRLRSVVILIAASFLAVPLTSMPSIVAAEETHTEFNVEKDAGRKGNLFDLIFGSPPPLATQRAILLIDAFFDVNGNGRRESGENDLNGEIFCLVDNVEYDVPAFIPGLSYRGSYKVLCAGDRYEPATGKEELFIERRGQIFRIDIPCRPVSDADTLRPAAKVSP